jgi:hypothetical protein
VSARGRIVGLVVLAAIAAVAVVGVAVVSVDDSGSAPAADANLVPDALPLSLALGFRSGRKAGDLARGRALYARG